MTLQQGETYPALASSHPVRCHLLRRRSQTCSTAWRYKAVRGSWSGKGSNVCNRGGSKRVPLQCSSQGSLSSMALAEAGWYGGARKKQDWIVVSLGRTAAYLHSYFLCPFCPFWSPKASIFTCKAMSFIVIESIFRLIVSVSMLTALPTASTKTVSLVRLWTAVPVFWIFR